MTVFYLQVSKRSLLRQLMGGGPSSSDALAQVIFIAFPFCSVSVFSCFDSYALNLSCSEAQPP